MITRFSHYMNLTLLCSFLYTSAHAQDTTAPAAPKKMDTAGIVVPANNYVLLRQPYRATIYLPAVDSGNTIEVLAGGGTVTMGNGKAEVESQPNKEGVYRWTGMINIRRHDTLIKTYMLPETTYTVFDPMAFIELANMNAIYIGIENQVTVKVPKFLKDKVKFSIDNGPIVTGGENGNYTITATKPGQYQTSIAVEYEPGKMTVIQHSNVRAKRLPNPQIKFAGMGGGNISKARFNSNDKLYANIEDFDFVARFTINHFSLLVRMPGQIFSQVLESTSNTLTPDMKAAFKGLESGAIVIFKDIEAEGPDLLKRKVDPISFIID